MQNSYLVSGKDRPDRLSKRVRPNDIEMRFRLTTFDWQHIRSPSLMNEWRAPGAVQVGMKV